MEQLVWLVPIAVLLAGVFRPHGGLVVFAATLPLFGSPPGGPYLAAFDVAAVAAIVTSWRASRPERSPVDWYVWGWVAVSVVSLTPLAFHPPSWDLRVLWGFATSLHDIEPWMPAYGSRALLSLCLGVGLYHSVRRAFAGRSLVPLIRALALGVVLSVALGLAAHVELISLEAFRVKGGPAWEDRLHSLFFHSGWYAEYLVLALPPALVALVGFGRWGAASAVGLLALSLPSLFLTAQRGAWLTALGQGGLAAVLGWRQVAFGRIARWVAVGALVLTLLLLAIVAVAPDAFSAALERTQVSFRSSGRLFIWQFTREAMEERPILGWGTGSFSPLFQERIVASRSRGFDWLTAHSQYLMITVERGLVGLASFAALCVALASCLLAGLRSRSLADRHLAQALWVSLAGLLAYGVVQYMFFLRAIEWLFWLLAGAATLLAPTRSARWLERGGQAVLVVALLLLPWRLVSHEPLEVSGSRAFGFHLPEQSGDREFQWTTGYAAWLAPNTGEELVLELFNGHPRPDLHRVEVTVRVAGAEISRQEVGARWTPVRLRLGPPTGRPVLVELQTSSTFRPFQEFRRLEGLGPSVDVRRLGIAVSPAPVPRQRPGSVRRQR